MQRRVLCRAGAATPDVHGRGADVHNHETAPAVAFLPSTTLPVESTKSIERDSLPHLLLSNARLNPVFIRMVLIILVVD